ncbi:MAG: ribonuclease HI [Saccharofermentans sp.]|nr:ribonuclease HI [Saccharofermentans sp.]
MPELTKVTIYTDGACSGNPGPGGWGAILMAGGKSREMSGGEAHTTNNRMELMAVIKSLALLTRPCEVDIYSDSAYVVNAFNQNWIVNWQRNGWKNSAKAEVANKDLWMELLRLTAIHKVTFLKVKGHADNEFNNRCDELAVEQSRKYAKES